jgi:hypothetical protein
MSASAEQAFIWDATNGLRNLRDVLVDDLSLDLTGWSLTHARAISDDGLAIVGEGRNPSGNREAWLVIIPEPSTALLLASGLAALTLGQRTKRDPRSRRPLRCSNRLRLSPACRRPIGRVAISLR